MSRLLAVFYTILVGSFFSCAGYPHQVTSSRHIGESFGFSSSREYGSQARDFMASLGADYARRDIYWDEIQKTPGPFDFAFFDEKLADAKLADLKVLATLLYDTPWIHENPKGKRQVDPDDFPAWQKYVQAVAERYGDQVAAFEVWNEPNLNIFWSGTDEVFFELTALTVKTLKQISPETPVSVGALLYHPVFAGKSWLKKFLASGAADQADALSIHFYGVSPVKAARRLVEVREMLDEHGFDGEIWVTEFGLTTGGIYPHKVRPELQGAQAAKWISALYAAGADKLIWYQLFDGRKPEEGVPSDSESLFGIAYYGDYELKTGGQVMRQLVPDIIRSSWEPQFASTENPSGIASVVYPFLRDDGQVTAVAWTKIGRPRVTLNGFPNGATIYDTRTQRQWNWNPGEYFDLNPEPLIIKGKSDGDIGFSR